MDGEGSAGDRDGESGVVLSGGDCRRIKDGIEESSAGWEGKEVWGEGGGNTKDVGRSEVARGLLINVGARMGGMTSVSYEGMTLMGDARESLDTRVVLRPVPIPAFPTRTLAGDFRGDFFGEERTIAVRLGEEEGWGVGGRSASIISTCHDRFSSKSLIRSA